MSAESVKWRKPVRPGDTLVIEVELTKSRGKIGKARGVCSVNGEPVSEAEVTFMLVDQPRDDITNEQTPVHRAGRQQGNSIFVISNPTF